MESSSFLVGKWIDGWKGYNRTFFVSLHEILNFWLNQKARPYQGLLKTLSENLLKLLDFGFIEGT